MGETPRDSPVRLAGAELAAPDAEAAQAAHVAEVAGGRAADRSDAVRRALARLQRDQRSRGEAATLHRPHPSLH